MLCFPLMMTPPHKNTSIPFWVLPLGHSFTPLGPSLRTIFEALNLPRLLHPDPTGLDHYGCVPAPPLRRSEGGGVGGGPG